MSRVYEALKKAEAEVSLEKTILKPQEKVSVLDQKGKIALPEEIDSSLVILTDPKSQAAEQFKKLRTRILQYSQGKNLTILITSSFPLEGKSFTIANLAVAFAQKPESYALLIDADLRKPSIHKILGIKAQYGLSEYLEGKTELSNVFYKTFIPRLSLIPAGNSSTHPAELLSSQKMKNLVEEVKNRYPDRYIFIDSTPLLITSEPDILADQVDGILLVVQYGKTQQDTLKRTLTLLEGKKIWGMVFNKVNPKSIKYKYNYSSYYYYKKK